MSIEPKKRHTSSKVSTSNSRGQSRRAPSAVATPCQPCRASSSSSRPGGGGLDDGGARHDDLQRQPTAVPLSETDTGDRHRCPLVISFSLADVPSQLCGDALSRNPDQRIGRNR